MHARTTVCAPMRMNEGFHGWWLHIQCMDFCCSFDKNDCIVVFLAPILCTFFVVNLRGGIAYCIRVVFRRFSFHQNSSRLLLLIFIYVISSVPLFFALDSFYLFSFCFSSIFSLSFLHWDIAGTPYQTGKG